MRFARIPALAVGLAIVATGCGESTPTNPLAERGRHVYLSQCIACHNPEPGIAAEINALAEYLK